jgi:hypothetical protein
LTTPAITSKQRGLRLGWYSDLTPVERRTYWACFAGFGLDSMDTTIYALVIPSLIAVLGLTAPQAGYLATAALIGTAVGGWGGGILADRIGRIRVLQLTILWVAIFTFAAAFGNSFAQLFGIRFLQGLGYGGEAAVGGVLISEVVRPALRGRVAASVQLCRWLCDFRDAVTDHRFVISRTDWLARLLRHLHTPPRPRIRHLYRGKGGSRRRSYSGSILGNFHSRSPAPHRAGSHHGYWHLRRRLRDYNLAADLSPYRQRRHTERKHPSLRQATSLPSPCPKRGAELRAA